MKSIILSIAVFLTATYSATAQQITKKVNTEESEIEWKGYKVLGSHNGEIDLKEGELIFENNELKGGSFVVDMTSIEVKDLEGEYAQKLENHLKNDDFFGVDKYPTATLKITNVKKVKDNAYNVKGDLTIKGKTNPVEFVMNISSNEATAKLKVNRTLYDIKYKSNSFFDGLGDKAIYDEFDLDVELEF